jgi:predicted RNA methylase
MSNTSDDWREALSYEQVIKRYGEWTAMSIYLGEGQYSLTPPKADYRLRRLVQIAADVVCKPLNKIRVLDLACLEGHYGLEFAQHGAEVVGIEIRSQNLAKAQFAKHFHKLDNFHLYQDDVRNLNKEKYGTFDVVLCSGILYHLEAYDVFKFVRNIYEVCDQVVLFDTFVSLSDRKSVEWEGKTYWGLDYVEHAEETTEDARKENLWASIDNTSSFWLTQPSLCNLMAHVGFTSFYESHVPTWPNEGYLDRRTYVAIKGKPVKLLSSPVTEQTPHREIPEGPINASSVQKQRGLLFKWVKKTFPQPIKDMIKPVLRLIGLLEPDGTPQYMRKLLKENKKN